MFSHRFPTPLWTRKVPFTNPPHVLLISFQFSVVKWALICLFVDVSAQVWRLHLWCVDANGVEVATIWRILQPWDLSSQPKIGAKATKPTYDWTITVSNQKPLPGKEPQSHSPLIFWYTFHMASKFTPGDPRDLRGLWTGTASLGLPDVWENSDQLKTPEGRQIFKAQVLSLGEKWENRKKNNIFTTRRMQNKTELLLLNDCALPSLLDRLDNLPWFWLVQLRIHFCFDRPCWRSSAQHG